MRHSDIEDFMTKEIARLENELVRLRKAYSAYIEGGDAVSPKKTSHAVVSAITQKKPRKNIILLVDEALSSFSLGETFRTEDVFKAIGRTDLEYNKLRSGLSLSLSKLVAEGVLEKVARGVFKRID